MNAKIKIHLVEDLMLWVITCSLPDKLIYRTDKAMDYYHRTANPVCFDA